MSRQLAFHPALRVAACVAAVFAAACGGGGDGGEILPPPPELLQITAANQVAVAQAVALDFGVLDSTRDIPVPTSSSAPRASGADAPVKRALGAAIATAGRALPLATTSITETCPAGGSITITIDDRDNSGTPSAGDVLTTAFNDCKESATSLLKGGFTLNFASYSSSQFSGLLTFGQLTLSDEDGTVAMNGPANVVYNETTAPGSRTERMELTVAAGGLVASVSTPRYSETLSHDPGFAGIWTSVYLSGANEGYDTSVLNGRVGFASLNGKVILATDPPVKELFADDTAESGTVLITGYQSKLRMTVLNTTTARLELDANNDGVYESTRDIPWSELMPF
jgi:hypothetical protein